MKQLIREELEAEIAKDGEELKKKRELRRKQALVDLENEKKSFQNAQSKAMAILTAGLEESAQELIRLQKFSPTDQLDSQSARIRLDAIKHNLKVNGLEVERVKLSGDSESPIVVVDAGSDPYRSGAQN